MNPKINYYCGWCHYEREEKKPTLSELQDQMEDINLDIAHTKGLHISESIKRWVLIELEQKKAELVKAMHKCIDEMYS